MAEKLDKNRIHEFFELLDMKIEKDPEQPDIKFELIAVGGTSLTLRDIKASTKDIDFMVEGTDIAKVKKWTRSLFQRLKLKVDMWQFPFIFSTTLPGNCSSDVYHKKYKHFDVKLINLVDNAVAKLARFNEADKEDIWDILRSGIGHDKILERFEETLKHNGFANKEEAKRNKEIFKRIYGL